MKLGLFINIMIFLLIMIIISLLPEAFEKEREFDEMRIIGVIGAM